MENFWRSNISDTSADILVNYKWGALLEMKEILWLRFKARRMPSTLFLCVPGWPEIGEQNSHALSLYITSHHWIRFIGLGFDFKTISKLLRQRQTALIFQVCFNVSVRLKKVSIDVPSSRSNPLLSCDPLQIWFNSPSLSGCILWSRNIPQNLPDVWKFESSLRVKQSGKFWTNICGQISPRG